MKKVILLLFLIFVCRSAFAADVLINEFAVEPAQSVELINNTSETVDVSNWYIDDSGGTTYFTIPSSSLLYPNSCLVFSGEFNLNKSSADTIRLFNNTFPPTNVSAVLIDSFAYSSSPGIGISHLRQPDKSGSWITVISSFGKLNQSGENCLFTPTETPTTVPTPTTIPSEEPTSAPAFSYPNIYISEVMVAPESGQSEWVEFYNGNDSAATLANWYVDDEENAGASPKSFSLTIPTKGYASFELSTSMFNNDADSVRLLDTQKSPKDSLEYTSSTKGKTLGRISFEDDKFCLQEPTKGQENGSCIEETPTPEKEETEALETASSAAAPNDRSSASKSASARKEKPAGLNPPTNPPNSTGSVLGEQNEAFTLSGAQSLLGKPFSFISFSYSLLTIISILLRMRFNA